jgi:hypothetical protein
MKNISDYISQFIDIKDKKAHSCLCKYVENIIFNITSITAIIAFINNSKSITKKNISIVESYIKSSCKIKMRGGGGSIIYPSEFYGVDSGRYLTTNNTTDILNIDFNSGIARPQIGGGKVKNPIPKAIQEILDGYKLTITSDLCKKLTKIINEYLLCLINKLKTSNKIITPSFIKKTVTSSKTFDIFK